MKNTPLALLLMLLLLGTAAVGQTKVARELIKNAEQHINLGNFVAAITDLEAAENAQPKSEVVHRLLGACYAKMGKYDKSAASYEKMFKIRSNFTRGAYYECAVSYMKQYEYAKALDYFVLYKHSDVKDYKMVEQTIEMGYDAWVDIQIANCEFAVKIDFKEVVEPSENLGSTVNSPFDEYLPTLTNDGQLLVYTRDKGDEDVMVSKVKSDGSWAEARGIDRAINSELNEGMAKLTICGRTLYFSACGWENGSGGCDIFEAKFDQKEGQVSDVKPASGLNGNLWESQPSISCDGKTMYFTSNRDGGYGGTDIWMSTLGADGRWGPAENLGPIVNTRGDEEAPYIAPDGISLYFSSNGHPGLGEADIFRTEKLDAAHGYWGVPINLGQSINTPFREAGISISPDGETAFFASARPNGSGGLDIYKAKLYREIAPIEDNVMLEGVVFDAVTGDRIEAAAIKIGKTGEPKRSFVTDEEGRFFICLASDAAYSYIVEKAGYETLIEANNFKRDKEQPTLKLEIALRQGRTAPVEVQEDPSVVVPKPKIRKNLSVYFETGKYELTDLQRSQIEQLITQFEDKGGLKLRVTGYADDVGNAEFNQSLSEKRAGYVAQYIETIGVPKEQISYDGKGVVESNIAKHQKRRVEIIILN